MSLKCDMRCAYCFSLDIEKNRIEKTGDKMNIETLERIVIKTLSAASRQCTFAFQGGEPTQAGLDFYKHLIGFVNRYNNKRIDVLYAIQTNGYNIDREFADFFAEHRFLVGLSLDGVKSIHDMYRKDITGKGTFLKVMHAAQLFNNSGVEYNILTVITAQTAKSIGQIYGFFSRNNFLYQQYIPCLDPLDEKRGQHDYSLTPKLYGNFLCSLFDLWYNDFIRGKRVSIRYFDNLVQMIMGYPPENCAMIGHCSRQIVVDADGSVYPCDFYVLDEYRLGNLRYDDFDKIEKTRDALGFRTPSMQKSPYCDACRWYSLCRGGCFRERDTKDETGTLHNYYCNSYKKFFEYAYPRLEKCAGTFNRF